MSARPAGSAARSAPRQAPATSRKPPSRARVERIRRRLRGRYGTPVMAPHGDALGELVLTVLSQSTNDRNRDVAFLRLTERYGAWPQVRDAPSEQIERAIRPGGISKVKSGRIKAILAAISAQQDGRLSLTWLAEAPVAEGRAFLTALPGVGRKTAACVLLFSFGLRDVPVDTHVARVGRRLGLLPATGSFELLHERMLALTPPGAELELHVNLLRHGRRICSARSPACERCVLALSCDWRRAQAAGR